MKNIDVGEAIMIAILGRLCALFAGTPDLMDAIIYALTGGKLTTP